MKSSMPPPPPTGGNAKYVIVILLLLVGAGGIYYLRQASDDGPAPVPSVIPRPSTDTTSKLDDVPPPPPEQPDAGPEPKSTGPQKAWNPCDVSSCSGSATPALERALQFRAQQARRCYESALAQDSTLKGNVQIRVRVASTGKVCSADVTKDELANPSVGSCMARTFRQTASFPAPKGGCVDINVPIKLVPRGQE